MLVTTKVTGPAASLSAAGAHPSSVIATLTVRPPAPLLATAVAAPSCRRACRRAGRSGPPPRRRRATLARTRGRTASGAEDDREHRDGVEQPADDLDHGRLGWMPSMPVMSDAQTVPGRMTALRSSAWLWPADDPAGLGRGVQRRGDEPRGDEHEHHAGDAEEAREVQAHAAAVDPVAERDRHGEAENAPSAGRDRVARRRGRRRAGRPPSRSPRAGRRGRPWRRAPGPSPAPAPPRPAPAAAPLRSRACRSSRRSCR